MLSSFGVSPPDEPPDEFVAVSTLAYQLIVFLSFVPLYSPTTITQTPLLLSFIVLKELFFFISWTPTVELSDGSHAVSPYL